MKFGSLLTAMVTPFKEDSAFDSAQAARLARHLLDIGNDGVIVAGTTGESPTLTDEEKLALFRVTVEEVGGEGTVIAGTGTNDTASSVALTQEAEKLGVDGIMAVVPYYNRPPQQGLYEHFRAIAQSTSLPVMLYDVPSRTATSLEPSTVARLAQIDNIVAIKDASGDMQRVAALRRMTSDDFDIYAGDDVLTLPMLSIGGAGVVSVAAHVVGRRLRALIEAYRKGDVHTAASIHLELLPIFDGMFLTTNPIPVKAAVNLLGIDVGPVRPPLSELSDEEMQALRRILEENGLLN